MQRRTPLQPLSILYFGSLFVALAGLLAYHAFLSPAVQFLRPASDGRWIVHPNLPPGEPNAEFVLRFALASVPPSVPVQVTTMRSGEITVNGQALPKVAPANWKDATAYDFAPALHAGDNEIRIRVANRDSPPALLVEGPEAVRTDERWTVGVPTVDADSPRAAVADHGDSFLAPKPNVLAESPLFARWTGVFAAYCVLLAATLVPRRRRSRDERAAGSVGATTDAAARDVAAASPWRMRIVCLLVFALVAAVQLRNAQVYPLERGFDPIQHADYVKYIAQHWKVPYADEGWEMSQPPLYYAVGAVLYTKMGGAAAEPESLRAVQMLSPVTALALIALAWWMLAILFPAQTRMRTMGFVVAAVLPVTFYLGPQVSNELLAACVIAAAICLATREVERGTLRWRDTLFLGVACGLGLLSKYTGLFVFLSVLSIGGLRALAGTPDKAANAPAEARPFLSRFRHLVWVTLLAGITIAISGWLYARNLERFGTPFIGAWDDRSHFHIVHAPGYHTLEFYTRFGSVFWHELSRAPFASFWDGMYGSLWGDTYGLFLSRDSVQIQNLATACVWLGLLPTVAMLLGFCIALWHLLTRGWNHPYFVPVVSTALTVTAMISFTVEHPFYSVQKAHWGLSILPCAAAFAALGLEAMCQRLGRLRWAVYLDLAALSALVPYLFWYRGVG